MPNPQTLIVGAGLTGLSCAHHLRASGLVLEAQSAVGGAARTVRRGDFYFDCTGHWLHFKDPTVRDFVEALLPGELVQVARRAAVFSHGVYTAYPFQAHTHGLPTEVVAECLLGFFAARERTARGDVPRRTFEDFILERLGEGIARHFMVPYNQKLWTVHPREMAHACCGRFVPIPTAEEVVFGALRPEGAGRALGYNTGFLYPRRGGIGRLAEAMAVGLACEVRLSTPIVGVDSARRRVTLAGGERLAYQDLVVTLPLKALVGLIEDAPEAVRDAAAALRATSVTYWDVGVARPNAPGDYHWIYFPGADVPFYRAGSASAAVPEMAPPGHASFYVEVSHPEGTACPVRDAEILAGMRRVGLLQPTEEPVVWARTTIGCAYTIMDHAYEAARATIFAWLATQRIHPAGRYGAWMYDSMEGAIVQGREVAKKLNRQE